MQKYKKIAITGANSFLGTNVAREFCKRNIPVRAIVRHSNDTLSSLPNVDIVSGTPISFDDLCAAAAGCDAIVHIAAITDQSLLKYEQYRNFNVEAVKNVVAVARTLGIKRVLFVSSANAIGNGTPTNPATETTPLSKPYSEHLYGRSKVEAEAVLRAATDIESVIVNPTFMLGPYDSKPSSGKIIKMGYGKWIVFATPGGKNIVSVQAAAKAICNAVEDGIAGENYLLSGVDTSIADFYRQMVSVTGQKSIIIVVPRIFLIMAGYVGDLLRACGVKTQVSSINMRVVCEKEYYNGAKATAQLGLQPTEIKDCISKAIAWFKEHNIL